MDKIAELKGYVTALIDKYEDKGINNASAVPLVSVVTDLERVLDIIEDTEKPKEINAALDNVLRMEAMNNFISRRFLKNE